jgi:hypothetical protein
LTIKFKIFVEDLLYARPELIVEDTKTDVAWPLPCVYSPVVYTQPFEVVVQDKEKSQRKGPSARHIHTTVSCSKQ